MTRRLVLAAAFLLATAPLASAQTLKFQFKKGEQLNYGVESTTQMITNFMNNEIKLGIQQTLDFSWTVDDVDAEGKARASVKFGRIKLAVDSPKGKVAVDSMDDKEPDDPLAKKLRPGIMALSKVELTCTVRPTGEITDIKLSEAAQKAVKEAGNAGGVGDSVTEEGLQRLILGGVILPKDDAKEWSQKTDLKSPLGKITGTTHFSLDGVVEADGKKLHKIAIKPDLTLKPNPNPVAEPKVKTFMAKGQALFDSASGRVVEVTGMQMIEVSADMNNVTITQQMNVNSSLKLKK